MELNEESKYQEATGEALDRGIKVLRPLSLRLNTAQLFVFFGFCLELGR
jgi:hypothetical protein